MKRHIIIILFTSLLIFSCLGIFAQSTRDTASQASRLKWFREAKFGMFIHWGLYSQLAGKWKDVNYYGSGEWLMERARIPSAEYAQLANSFNPVDFNAARWAQIAKSSGVRYMVITAKHPEGFRM